MLVVNHDIVWLDIPMHDLHAVAVVQCLQDIVHVESDVEFQPHLVQLLKICVIDMLKGQGGCPWHRILDYVQKDNIVPPPSEIFQDLNFMLDLLYDCLEAFHHHLLTVGDIDGLEDLAVFAIAEFPHKLVIILVTLFHDMQLTVLILVGSLCTHLRRPSLHLALGLTRCLSVCVCIRVNTLMALARYSGGCSSDEGAREAGLSPSYCFNGEYQVTH